MRALVWFAGTIVGAVLGLWNAGPSMSRGWRAESKPLHWWSLN